MANFYSEIDPTDSFSMGDRSTQETWASICSDLYTESRNERTNTAANRESAYPFNSLPIATDAALLSTLLVASGDSSNSKDQFGTLPEPIADSLRQIGAKNISVKQNGDRYHVEIPLKKDYYHDTGEAKIPQVWLDGSNLKFDVQLKKDGTIELSNISGMGVKVSPQSRWAPDFWVYPKTFVITPPSGDGDASASITVTKLGVSRTENTLIPRASYDQLKDTLKALK